MCSGDLTESEAALIRVISIRLLRDRDVRTVRIERKKGSIRVYHDDAENEMEGYGRSREFDAWDRVGTSSVRF